MRKIIHVFNLNYVHEYLSVPDDIRTGEKQLTDVILYARELAEQEDVKMPNNITFGGNRSGWTYVNFTSNKVRDLLIRSLDHFNIPYMNDQDYTRDKFQEQLKQLEQSSS